LDRKELHDSLDTFATIPEKLPLDNRLPPSVTVTGFDDWPFKIVFASRGISPQTILGHLTEYYAKNPKVALNKRPNLVHVAGGYSIVRVEHFVPGVRDGTPLRTGEFYLNPTHSYGWGLAWAVARVQGIALASRPLILEYADLVNSLSWPAGERTFDPQRGSDPKI
jgi:hypothetical protein